MGHARLPTCRACAATLKKRPRNGGILRFRLAYGRRSTYYRNLFISLKLIVSQSIYEYENVFIAGQNRRAGYATEAFCSRSAVIPIMVIFYITIILSFIHCLMELQMVYPVLALQN